MKVEIIKKLERLSKSNANWLQVFEDFGKLKPTECLRITGLDKTAINSLRQQAYREARARAFTRIEGDKPVLYLYKPK